jgi:hypothetical protein
LQVRLVAGDFIRQAQLPLSLQQLQGLPSDFASDGVSVISGWQ